MYVLCCSGVTVRQVDGRVPPGVERQDDGGQLIRVRDAVNPQLPQHAAPVTVARHQDVRHQPRGRRLRRAQIRPQDEVQTGDRPDHTAVRCVTCRMCPC